MRDPVRLFRDEPPTGKFPYPEPSAGGFITLVALSAVVNAEQQFLCPTYRWAEVKLYSVRSDGAN